MTCQYREFCSDYVCGLHCDIFYKFCKDYRIIQKRIDLSIEVKPSRSPQQRQNTKGLDSLADTPTREGEEI